MGVLAVALGTVLLIGSTLNLWRVVRRAELAAQWAALDDVARSLDRAGFDQRFVTRGFYLHHVFLGLLGMAMVLAGVDELIDPDTELIWIAIGLMLAAVVVEGVAAVTARTGHPSAWVPPPHRE